MKHKEYISVLPYKCFMCGDAEHSFYTMSYGLIKDDEPSVDVCQKCFDKYCEIKDYGKLLFIKKLMKNAQ